MCSYPPFCLGQISTATSQTLRPWMTVRLVSAGGTPLTVHECASVRQLGEEVFLMDVVIVGPLTSEAILGVDFLQKEHASIDLSDIRLHLKERGCDIPLRAPASLMERGDSHLVRSAATVDVPPHSSLQIVCNIEAPVEAVWLLEESMSCTCPC